MQSETTTCETNGLKKTSYRRPSSHTSGNDTHWTSSSSGCHPSPAHRTSATGVGASSLPPSSSITSTRTGRRSVVLSSREDRQPNVGVPQLDPTSPASHQERTADSAPGDTPMAAWKTPPNETTMALGSAYSQRKKPTRNRPSSADGMSETSCASSRPSSGHQSVADRQTPTAHDQPLPEEAVAPAAGGAAPANRGFSPGLRAGVTPTYQSALDLPSIGELSRVLSRASRVDSPHQMNVEDGPVLNSQTNSKPSDPAATSTTKTVPAFNQDREQRASRVAIQDLKGLAKSLRLVEPAPPRSWRAPEKDDSQAVNLKFGIKFIVGAIVVLSIALLLLRTLIGKRPMEPYCKTTACFRHAELLTATLNRSLDPCSDFQAYVCSAWKPPGSYLDRSRSAMDDVRKSWFPAFHDMLLRGHRILEVARKPLAMYEHCIGDHSKYGSGAAKFWDILENLGLSWPYSSQSPSNVSAFYVLFTLKFSWNVPLLLEVKILRLNYTPQWRFTVAPGSLIPVQLNHHDSVAESERYKYWRSFYDILLENASQAAITGSAIDAILKAEGEILGRLYRAMASQATKPMLVTVAQMTNYTPSVTSNEWLSALRQTKLDPAVSSDDQVLLMDGGFSREFGRMLQDYTNEQLLMFIAWSFVQLYAPTADYRLLMARYGDAAASNRFRPYFCERFVESAYGLLVVAANSVSRFLPEERAFVTAGFNNLVRTASSKANGAVWLDVENRRTATTKINSALLHLWPPVRYLNNEELDRLYNAFPSDASSFFEYWVASSESLAAVSRSQVNTHVLNYPVNYELPYLRYDRPTGTLNVAVGAVNHPLYYGNGTSAMFYGGLGFSMALQLVKSLDHYGLQWHLNGTFGGSIFTRDSMEAYKGRDSCLDSNQGQQQGRRSSLFPEIPAIEVTYGAYLDEVRKSGGAPQGIAPDLSGDQVFFSTLCYMTCSTTSERRFRFADCNKAVRNFPAFAQAFQCPSGSAMNPERKCSFF